MARNHSVGFSVYDLMRAYDKGYAKGWADAMADLQAMTMSQE